MAKPKVWTPEETEFLRKNYMTMTNAQLAAKLNVTQASVRSKLRRLKLARKAVEEKKETAPVSLEKANALYYEERKYADAAQEFADAAKRSTDPTVVGRALYWQAECMVKLGQNGDACKLLGKVTEVCPDHYLAGAAERRLSALATG